MLLASSFFSKMFLSVLNSKNQGSGLVFKPLQPNKKIEKKSPRSGPIHDLFRTLAEGTKKTL